VINILTVILISIQLFLSLPYATFFLIFTSSWKWERIGWFLPSESGWWRPGLSYCRGPVPIPDRQWIPMDEFGTVSKEYPSSRSCLVCPALASDKGRSVLGSKMRLNPPLPGDAQRFSPIFLSFEWRIGWGGLCWEPRFYFTTAWTSLIWGVNFFMADSHRPWRGYRIPEKH
jgi:hypothetical protein